MKDQNLSVRTPLTLTLVALAAVLAAALLSLSLVRAQDAGPAGEGSIEAVENGNWVPATPQTFTYTIPFTTGVVLRGPFVVSVSDSQTLIPGSAIAQVCYPATSCAFYPVTAQFPTPTSAVLTATDIPISGTGQTIQFFVSPSSGPVYASPRHQFVRITPQYLPLVMHMHSISGRIVNAIGQGVPNVLVFSSLSGSSDLTGSSGNYVINNAAGGTHLLQPSGTTPFGTPAGFYPTSRQAIVPPSAADQDFLWQDDNPCRAIDVMPGFTYSVNPTGATDNSPLSDRYDFLRLNVTGTTPLVITMTQVQSPGQLQLRGPIKDNLCDPIGSTDLVDSYFRVFNPAGGVTSHVMNVGSIPAGLYFARFNVDVGAARSPVPYAFTWNFGSASNVNACSAQTINLGTTYQATPDRAENWFAFDVPATSTIVVTVTGYTATGQYQIMRQLTSGCTTMGVDYSWPPLVTQTGTSNPIVMTLVNQPAGRYFLRFATSGNFNGTPFSFRVTTTAGSVNPAIDTCNPPGQAGCELKSGPNVTVYWFNMTGVTQLTLRLDGRSISGGTCGSQAVGLTYGPFVINNPVANGSFTFTGVLNGFYAFGGSWQPPFAGGADSKPLKVGCTLLNSVPSLTPPVLGPELPAEGEVIPLPPPDPDVPPAP